MLTRIFVCVATLTLVATRADATEYYVHPAGNDLNAGTSPSVPWRTLSRVNQVSLRPGDRVYLASDQTFGGMLSFDSADAGTDALPIVVSSYGGGRATIAAGTSRGIWAYNTAGITVSNINVVGAGRTVNTFSGVEFYSDVPGGVKLGPVRLERVDVSGFGQQGVAVGSWNGSTGFRDVVVHGVVAHDNGRAGIITYAQAANAHENVYVGYSSAFNNSGVPGLSSNSGNGIVLGNVRGGTIERSIAHDNGWLNTSVGGPVGIWTYDSTSVLIQFNESYANRTASTADGGGFDLDQNVSNSIMQYNYSHDNDGAGYLLAQGPSTDAHWGNIVRYNISQNDGRANVYGGVHVWGRVRTAEIHNNTVFVAPSANGRPRAAVVVSWGAPQNVTAGVHIRNNIFITTGGVPVVEVDAPQRSSVDLQFQGNTYFAGSGQWSLLWAGVTYTTLNMWRDASAQERIYGAAAGSSVDPLVSAAGSGPTFGDAARLETMTAYRLQGGSPAIDAGLNLASIGTRDFFGTPVPQGASADVGASEYAGPPSPPPPATAPAPAPLPPSPSLTIPGTIEAEDFDAGANGVAYYDDTAANYGGQYGSTEVDIESTTDPTGGRFNVGWMSAGEWMTYTVNVQSAGTYQLRARVACPGSGGRFHLEVGGIDRTGPLVVSDTGGWQQWTFVSTNLTLAAGVQTLRFVVDAYGTSGYFGNLNYMTFALAPATAPVPSPPPAEIVIHARDVAASAVYESWAFEPDSTAADGVALATPDAGWSSVSAPWPGPAKFIDVTFEAPSNVPYRVWVRLKAIGNSKWNDSVWLQFSDATANGASAYPIGTASGLLVNLESCSGCGTSGWGWLDGAWWLQQPSVVSFTSTARHTLRIQVREDGVMIDQIVLSPYRFLNNPPGPIRDDVTILSR